MSFLGNIIWFIFGGFIAGLIHIIGGIALCFTIIGIPMGFAAIQFGVSVMVPFGKESIPRESGGNIISVLLNIIWLILFGWEIALVHLVFGLLFFITIIGIPFAMQHFKLIPIALLPFSYHLSKKGSD